MKTFHILSHVFISSTGVSSTETAQGTLCTPTKRPRESGTVRLFFLPLARYDLPHFEG